MRAVEVGGEGLTPSFVHAWRPALALNLAERGDDGVGIMLIARLARGCLHRQGRWAEPSIEPGCQPVKVEETLQLGCFRGRWNP